MNRRTFLTAVSATAVAGCGGSDYDDPPDQGPNQGGGGANRTPEPEPTDTPRPTAEPVVFEGAGSQATEGFTVSRQVVVFALGHGGRRNFSVWLLNDRGEREELLANTIGQYRGLRILNLSHGRYFLDISADGNWRAEIRQFQPFTGGVSLPISEERSAASFFTPFSSSGAVRMAFEGFGSANYAVWLRDGAARRVDLLFNEIGPTGRLSTIFSPPNPAIVSVDTTERWNGSIESA